MEALKAELERKRKAKGELFGGKKFARLEDVNAAAQPAEPQVRSKRKALPEFLLTAPSHRTVQAPQAAGAQSRELVRAATRGPLLST